MEHLDADRMGRLISFPVDRVRKLVLLKTALKVQGLINYVSTFQGRNYDILGHAAVELGR